MNAVATSAESIDVNRDAVVQRAAVLNPPRPPKGTQRLEFDHQDLLADLNRKEAG